METQAKLLSEQYITTRLGEIKEIKKGEITYTIHKSDRENSNSVYISFYKKGDKDKLYKESELRISDHPLKGVAPTETTQFIIDTTQVLNSKKKTLFMKTIERTIKRGLNRSLRAKLNNLSKESVSHE